MIRRHPLRAPAAPRARHALALAAMAAMLSPGMPASAQTRSARDTATAYGARLNAKGEPADLNPNRINNRVNSRLETRLSLRIERYRPDSTSDPAAAFAVRPTDNARIGTQTTLSPLSTSTATTMSQAYEGSPQPAFQPSSAQADDPARPR